MIKLLSAKIINYFEIEFLVESEVGQETVFYSCREYQHKVEMIVDQGTYEPSSRDPDLFMKRSGIFKDDPFIIDINTASRGLVLRDKKYGNSSLLFGNMSAVIKTNWSSQIVEVEIFEDDNLISLINDLKKEWVNMSKSEKSSTTSNSFTIEDNVQTSVLSYYGYTGYVVSNKVGSTIEVHYQDKPLARLEGVIEDELFFVEKQSILALDEFPAGYTLIPFESMGSGFRDYTSNMPGFKDVFATIVNGIIAYKVRFPHGVNGGVGTLYQEVTVLS